MKNIINNFIKKFLSITKGNIGYNTLLFALGFCPAICLFLFHKKIENAFLIIKFLLSLFIFVYYVWHLYVIYIFLKIHPEYKEKKVSKKELYKDKTKEEIEKIKKEKFKSNLQKFFLLKSWKTRPNHEWIICLDLLFILTYFRIIINIFK